MRHLIYLLPLLFFSCGSPTYPPAENPLDAGRQFAEAIYGGNFERAGQLIVPDEENKTLLQKRLEENYHQRNNAVRTQMQQTSLQILNVQKSPVDSMMLIRFTNAYDGQPATLKVVKQNSKWLVDLKYTYSGK